MQAVGHAGRGVMIWGSFRGHCVTVFLKLVPRVQSDFFQVCVDTEWWQTLMVPTFCRTGVQVGSSMVVFLDSCSLTSLHCVLPCSAIWNRTRLVDVDVGCL